MKRRSFIVCTIALLAGAAAGERMAVWRGRCRDSMPGGCASYRRRSLHAGYTLADVR